MTSTWQWDPTLYAGAAAYYPRGRVAYPAALATAIQHQLGLDGHGRLLDVGCGPGSLTLRLASAFAQVVGVDADADMVAQAERIAREQDVRNVSWVAMRAEALPGSLGFFDVVTFAQSFHWMERERVASIVHDMIVPGGACLHVAATTHRGTGTGTTTGTRTDTRTDTDTQLVYPGPLVHPRPPYERMSALVRAYLGEQRRAGAGVLPQDTPSGEAAVFQAAGFSGPDRFEVPLGVVTRSVDDLVAGVFSLSSSTPHLFGERVAAFESELRALLREASPQGRFSEQMRPVAVDIWRPTTTS